MLNIERWVDPRARLVQLPALEKYLERHGWRRKPHPSPYWIVYTGPYTDDFGDPINQVFYTEECDDFHEGIVRVITNLSLFEDRHPVEVLNDILQIGADETTAAPAGGNGTQAEGTPAPASASSS